MSTQRNDILVEIPEKELPTLALFYREKADWAPHMVSFINMVIKWKKSEKHHNYVRVFSPKNTWQNDGTIIARISMTNTMQDIIVFTLNDCSNLLQGLTDTKLLNFGCIRTCFYGVYEKHIPCIRKLLRQKNLAITCNLPCYMFAISPEEAQKFTVKCPPEVYVQRLKPQAGQRVSAVWPHRFQNSEMYLSEFIEANGGYGVFLKETDEMVAWVLKHAWGHLAMLQTEEAHQRKGYGSLVTQALAKEIGVEGFWPFVTTLLKNDKVICMLEKLGFQRIGTCSFIIVDDNDSAC